MINDIQLDPAAPLQQQLYRQLSQRIIGRRYLPGSQLPSSRQLAADLGVSRNTVNAVYDQLKAEGFLLSLAGKGVFINKDIRSTLNQPDQLPSHSQSTTAPLP